MLRKTIISTLTLLCLTAYVSAADLPAELMYDNLSGTIDGFVYLTQDGKICFIDENEPGVNDTFEYYTEKKGEYFYNIKSLCSGYLQSVYFPESNSFIDSLFIKNDGTLWGYSFENGMPRCAVIKGVKNCIKACTGSTFAIALQADGTVYTWGYKYYGDRSILEKDSPGYVSYPEKVEGLENIVDIAVDDVRAYALDSDGYVYVWGNHMYNDTNENNMPIKIPGIENCVEIDKGVYLLARTNTGKVYQLADRCQLLSFPAKYYTPTLIKDVDDCIQMTAVGAYNEGLMLTADSHILYYEGNVFNILTYGKPEKEGAEMHRVIAEEFGSPMQVTSDHYIIMEDLSIWRMIYYANDDYPEFKCAVPADAEDKIKVDSIRFVKRSEMAKQLMDLYEDLTGETSITSSGCTYNDVDADSKYIEDIGKCCFLGLMNGTDAESFSPNKVLRREQLAVILDRLFSLTNTKCTSRTEAYADDSEISEWAKESVYKTASLFETSDGSYDPQEYVSYDELESVFDKVKSL